MRGRGGGDTPVSEAPIAHLIWTDFMSSSFGPPEVANARVNSLCRCANPATDPPQSADRWCLPREARGCPKTCMYNSLDMREVNLYTRRKEYLVPGGSVFDTGIGGCYAIVGAVVRDVIFHISSWISFYFALCMEE